MSTEENKELFRRSTEEVFNQGNLDVADELWNENHIAHVPPDEIKGPEGMKQFASQFRNSFPDIKMTIEDLIAEGDMVVARQTATGTHKGEFQGIAPTEKEVTITATVITRVVNGKFVESWTNMDSLGLMVQLGVVPPPQK